MCITNDKPFLTYEQQIAKLTVKGLTINNSSEATFLLKQHSYFALISGYKSPFKARNGDYKLHTTFEDIYALYTFDDTLRTIIFRNILKKPMEKINSTILTLPNITILRLTNLISMI